MTADFDQLLLPDVVSYVAGCDLSRPALVQQDKQLDYGQMHGRANQLAHFLRSQGVGRETKIGLSMERSIEFVVAALGILKCGAAYVPLDPAYPEARRRFIAEDAGVQLILSAGKPSEQALTWPARVIALGAPEILSQPTSDSFSAEVDPQQLAYVIYTSGSTGTAKGVEVTRGNLRHLVDWHNQAFGVTAEDRATLVANVGFDASVWEIWPYLSAGATLLIPPPEIIREPEMLKQWLVKMRVSILFAPTLLAEVLIASEWPANANLRCLLTGGDTLRTWPRPGLGFRVFNNYGPAECTVVSTSGEVLSSAPEQNSPDPQRTGQKKMPSIGYPIAGARVLLLDEELREVPAGSPGEICIAGEGVARGYLHQPELTARRFTRREEDGARFYRSGDLGRSNPDGSLQFLGRMDEQVKVRGYRIECGEIEAALNGLPAVETSAVVLREQRAGHKGLTAYIVPRAGADLSRDELRQALRLVLPEYMLPEQFVRLPHMPTSDNGKIDRRRLPSVTDEMIIASADQPLSPVESQLMAIMAKLLKVDHIERSDDFFLLGGHSFIAAQLIARIRDHFAVELNLRTVFENPTLAGMAQKIEQRMSTKP